MIDLIFAYVHLIWSKDIQVYDWAAFHSICSELHRTFLAGTLCGSQRVAVKSLKPAGTLSIKDFLKEAYVMHKLRHDRLVTLIGFCINPENSVYIVMEKMSKGALKDLLLKDRGKEIKFSQLMTMTKQV